MVKYQTFMDMEVWQDAIELSKVVFELTSSLPRSEDYALTSQLRRSSNSVSANIAEAYGRSTNKDKSYFYIISRGSAYETQSHLLYGSKINYFNISEIDELISGYNKLIHQLNKIIKTLR
jgi:four helix bundle protein